MKPKQLVKFLIKFPNILINKMLNIIILINSSRQKEDLKAQEMLQMFPRVLQSRVKKRVTSTILEEKKGDSGSKKGTRYHPRAELNRAHISIHSSNNSRMEPLQLVEIKKDQCSGDKEAAREPKKSPRDST